MNLPSVVHIDALSTEQVEQIDALIGQVMAHGYGQVTITIEKGRCRHIIPAPSIDMEQNKNAKQDKPGD